MRSTAKLVAVISLIAGGYTHACLFSFASLSADNVELVETTYGRLFDRLGAGLSIQTLEAMVAAKNPFALPDHTPEGDFGTLRKNMEQFRRLLRDAGLPEADVSASLLQALSHRLAEKRGQSKKIDVAVEVAEKDRVIPVPKVPLRILIPTGDPGRIAVQGGGRIPSGCYYERIALYDLGTGITSELTLPPGYYHSVISADGKYLVTAQRYNLPKVRPSVNGAIAKDGQNVLLPLSPAPPGEEPVGEVLRARARPGTDEVFLVHEDNYETAQPGKRTRFGLTALDPKTGSTHSIDGKKLWDGHVVTDWGFLPGSDRVYFEQMKPNVDGNNLYQLVTARLADGKLVPDPAPLHEWSMTYRPNGSMTAFTATRVASPTRAANFGSHGKLPYATLIEAGETIDVLANYSGPPIQGVHDVFVPSTGDKIWIQLNAYDGTRMHRFDVKTKQLDKQIALDPRRHYALTPDGTSFYSFNDDNFSLINRKRWEEEGR